MTLEQGIREIVREIVREEIRATRFIVTCKGAASPGIPQVGVAAVEIVDCVDVPCDLCRRAKVADLPIADPQSAPVYFIQSESNLLVKVGYGAPETRLSAMRSGSPVPLRLVALVAAGGKDLETIIHHQLRASKSHGEWFELTPPLVHLMHFVRRSWFGANAALPPVLVPEEWVA